jgi:hypothetical protein
MSDKHTFNCRNCHEKSEHTSRADEPDKVLRDITPFVAQEESRTYYCEHCGKPNKIKLLESQWMMIDIQSRK